MRDLLYIKSEKVLAQYPTTVLDSLVLSNIKPLKKPLRNMNKEQKEKYKKKVKK